jgi:hypothetical protein
MTVADEIDLRAGGRYGVLAGQGASVVAAALMAATISAGLGGTATIVPASELPARPAATASNLVLVDLLPSLGPRRPSPELMAAYAGALPPGTFGPGFLEEIRGEWE